MEPDADLVVAVRNGKTATRTRAYAELVNRYQRAAFSVAWHILRDADAAKDAVQEAFVTAYVKLNQLRDPAVFGPWLVQIARRQALDMARRNPAHEPLSSLDEASGHPAQGALDEEARNLLADVMELPHVEQQVVILKHFDGYSLREIAAMTGRSVGTLSKQLSRAYERLRRRLKGEDHGTKQ